MPTTCMPKDEAIRNLRMSVRAILVALFVVSSFTSAATSARAAGEIRAKIRAARDQFTPLTDEQLASARSELRQRAQELERFVGPSSSNGRKWMDFLNWDTFREQLARDGEPDYDPLLSTYQRLNRDETGLERRPFRRLSDSLRRYLDLSALARQDNQSDTYAQQLDALSDELDRYEEQPSAELAATIGSRLDFLAGVGQGSEVVSAIREQFARPNALVRVSAGLLNSATDPIDRSEPVTDCILGTSVKSDAHTVGSSEIRAVPSEEQARLEITSFGRVASRNVGYNGPAVIRSSSDTDFTSFVIVELSDAAFRSYPASVHATTNTDYHSISKKGGGFGSKLVSKIGWKKACEKKSQAEAIAADHAEDRIARRVADETTEKLADAWDRYQTQYRLPLVRRGELPEHIRFNTTSDAMHVEVTQASRSQLGAPGEPPATPADRDVVVALHETAANNYAAAVLSGVTIGESSPDAGTKADATMPDWIKDAWKNRMDDKAESAGDGEFEPWSLTFRRSRPVTVEFVDGKLNLTIHVAHLESGNDTFDRWDVTGTFAPEMADGGVTLRREGELEVLPTGFDREGGQLSSRDVALRRNLTKVLTERSDKGRGFPQTIKIDPLEPSGDLAKVGPLDVDQFETDRGWLTVAWQRH